MQEIIKPAFNKNNIPVVFSSDNNYAPYLGVVIQSLIMNSSKQYNYDIIILERNLSEINKLKIKSLAVSGNISIRFVNISHIIQKHKFHINTYFSEETYYRLFIPQIFENFHKVLYLDCDIIILNDIVNLYNINIENKLLAATYNVSTYIQTKYDRRVKNIPWRTYLTEKLKMQIPENYFQAGVLVLNVDKMKQVNLQENAIKKAESFDPVLVDQDVLNSLCENEVVFFSQKWNLHNCFSHQYNNFKTLNELPQYLVNDYLEARKDAYIIHYAGKDKPWSCPKLEYSNFWWYYARQTPFYEEIIYQNAILKPSVISNECLSLQILKDIANYHKNIFKYFKYKILSKITFGKKRKKYKQKRNELKQKIKSVQKIIKD